MKQQITKAELARQLGVSRAYITMIASGKRKPSQDSVNKLNSLNNVNAQLQKFNPKSCPSANSGTPPFEPALLYENLPQLGAKVKLCHQLTR